MPKFSPDDVVDFQVTEAIVLKAREMDKRAAEDQAVAQQEKATGKFGHRDADFRARARAAEAG